MLFRFIFRFALNAPLYYLSKIFPKQKGLIVVGSRQGYQFADNSMFYFLWHLKNKGSKNIYWVTKSKRLYKTLLEQGHPSLYLYSFKGFYLVLRAEVSVLSYRLSDVQEGLIGGSKIVQLWHGSPLRKIGYGGDWDTVSIKGKIKSYMYQAFPFTYYMACDVVVSSSDYVSRAYSEAFKYSFRKEVRICQIGGQTRDDYLLNSNELDLEGVFVKELKWLSNFEGFNKRYVWMPTQRVMHNKTFIEVLHQVKFDLKKLNLFLKKENSILFLKLHPLEIRNKELTGFSNIKLYGFPDPSPLIKQMDILITDYSSVCFDAMVLEVPIIYTPFDLEEYEKVTPLYTTFEEAKAFSVCTTTEEVMISMSAVLPRITRVPVPSTSYCRRINNECIGD